MVLKHSTPSARRVATWTWVLIFGGILMSGLGSVVARTQPLLGGGIVAVAVLAIAAGVVLIWVRSRMDEGDQP
jgi:hypothetical protein